MNAALLRAPRIAWPTLVLTALAVGGWLGAVGLGLAGLLPPLVAIALASVCAYATFSPMHDAAHRSVARARWVNEVAGRIAGLPLLAPFPAFRWMHLEHHKRTNEGLDDPDHWSGRGPWPLLPLRWLTQDLHYYARFVHEWGRFSVGARVEVVGVVLASLLALFVPPALGLGWGLALFVFLPARLATGALAFAFDYLPHRPHDTPAREDRFRATSNLAGRWLTVPFMSQNYHLVHHLYPGVPFYAYGRVWADQREELLANGAQELPLFGAERALARGRPRGRARTSVAAR